MAGLPPQAQETSMNVMQAEAALERAERLASQRGLSEGEQRARDDVVADMRRQLHLAEEQARRDLARSGRR